MRCDAMRCDAIKIRRSVLLAKHNELERSGSSGKSGYNTEQEGQAKVRYGVGVVVFKGLARSGDAAIALGGSLVC